MDETLKILQELRFICLFKHKLTERDNEFIFQKAGNDKQASKFVQELFRNLKLYDYIIQFVTKNTQIYIEVKSISSSELTDLKT